MFRTAAFSAWPISASAMTEADQPDWADGPLWDHIADVICVGSGPGVHAVAAVCAADGLDTLTLGWPSGPLDGDTATFIAAMTEDLGEPDLGEPDVQRDCAPIIAAAAEFRRGRGERLDTFHGAELRRWASQCLASESGVLFTQVPDRLLRPMRTGDGDLITAVVVPDDGQPAGDFAGILTGLILVDGRPAGALIDGPDGRLMVGAELGLAFAVGRADGARSAAPGDARPALVSRRGSLFARLQPMVRGD